MKNYFRSNKTGSVMITTVASALLLTFSEPVLSAVVIQVGNPNAIYVGRPLPYYGYGYRTGHYYGGYGGYHNGYYYHGNRYHYHGGYHRNGGGYYHHGTTVHNGNVYHHGGGHRR